MVKNESDGFTKSEANHEHTNATSFTPWKHLNKHQAALVSYAHTSATSFKPTKVKKVEHLRIGLEVIKLATSDFSKGLKFTGDSYSIFECKLECIDKEYLFGLNTETKYYNLPKRSYDVVIKHIHIEKYKLDTEIEILGSCMHRNIHPFLGFCDEGPGMILVFEFISYFDLDRHLGYPSFSWESWLKVCLDIAHGLYYLQRGMKDQKMVIHRDIKSANIGFEITGKDWMAYITKFRHAVFLPQNQHYDALQLNDNRPMTFYTDPEYANRGILKAESDVFSFGVILFEILCGITVDKIVSKESRQDTRLEQVVERWFQKGIIKNKLTTSLKQEKSENAYFLYNGINKDSLDTFIAIAYRCLAKLPNQRPTIEVIIEELEKSLSFQKNHKAATFRMSFEDIRKATDNFSHVIGEGGFGSVYIGEVAQKHSYGHYAIVAKKLNTSHGQGHPQFYNELQILYKYRHENIIGLVGYSDETDEKLIVYERAPKGSLDRYLNDVELTWRKRLMICIDIASGLDFLHGGVEGQEVVIHRDIKTPNILLFDEWKAKLGDFGLSLISNIDEDTHYTINRACGTHGYVDPLYLETGFLTLESDIYSFGVILFEILCGKATYKIPNLKGRSLLSFIRHYFEEGKKDEIVFGAIKEEIVPKSLTTFIDTVYKCLDHDRGKRPTSKEVLAQLKKALELQVEDAKEDIKPNFPEHRKEKLELS
ncbi:uncharacterized protein [Rutidosis leptorrhynchoides]|uniref:uncharacterized protein n=1 Tax=Rutidosis leptorrhynchoides TaxID=125765 RepID=UPI003A992E72